MVLCFVCWECWTQYCSIARAIYQISYTRYQVPTWLHTKIWRLKLHRGISTRHFHHHHLNHSIPFLFLDFSLLLFIPPLYSRRFFLILVSRSCSPFCLGRREFVMVQRLLDRVPVFGPRRLPWFIDTSIPIQHADLGNQSRGPHRTH